MLPNNEWSGHQNKRFRTTYLEQQFRSVAVEALLKIDTAVVSVLSLDEYKSCVPKFCVPVGILLKVIIFQEMHC
jgi:hypothetical protein